MKHIAAANGKRKDPVRDESGRVGCWRLGQPLLAGKVLGDSRSVEGFNPLLMRQGHKDSLILSCVFPPVYSCLCMFVYRV